MSRDYNQTSGINCGDTCIEKSRPTQHAGWVAGFSDGYKAWKGGSSVPPPISIPYPNTPVPGVWCSTNGGQGYAFDCTSHWRAAWNEGYAPAYKAGYAHAALDNAKTVQEFAAAEKAIAEAKKEAERNVAESEEAMRRRAEEISAALPQRPDQQFDPSAILEDAGSEAEKSSSSTGLAWLGAAAVLVVGGYLLFGGKKPIIS